MLLSRFPRVSLAHLPTPMEHLPRLSKHLDGPEIYVKRDDCTGLGTGGNKTRKLEYLMPEAIKNKASLIVTIGAVQSNHARQTAAACALLGLKCLIILEQRLNDAPLAYMNSGNVFLDNENITKLAMYQRARKGIGSVSYTHLTLPTILLV